MNTLSDVFRTVLEVSWRASCLIVAVFFLRTLLRRLIPARVLFWAWIAVAMRLLMTFTVPAAWSPYNLAPVEHRDRADLTAPKTVSIPVHTSPPPLSPAPPSHGDANPARPLIYSQRSLQQWVALAWAAGSLALLLARGWAHLRFQRQLRASALMPDSALAALVAETAAELNVRDVRVVITPAVGAPALYGLFRPRLLFPRGLTEQLTTPELRLVVFHELGHWRRRDPLAQTVIHVACIVHWFNPLAWIAARAARHDCELACNEFVVHRLGAVEPQAYGAILLKITGLIRPTPHARMGLGIVEYKQQLKRRLHMIIATKPATFIRLVLGSTVLALIVGLSLTREMNAQPQTVTTVAPVVTTLTKVVPTGWSQYGDRDASVVGVDPAQSHDGTASAYVKSIKPSGEASNGMVQLCLAEDYRGKRLRLSAWMKSNTPKLTWANDDGANLLFRVQRGAGSKNSQGFHDINSRPIRLKDTTEWQEYSLLVDVHSDATILTYGFYLQGAGQIWVSGFKIEVVGNIPPDSNTAQFSLMMPKAPVNLAFK